MTRKTYQTPKDAKRQRTVLDEVSQAWSCAYKEMKLHSFWDAYFYSGGKMRCVVEVKCRDNRMRKYPTLFISKNKILNCISEAKGKRVEFVLLVNWADGTRYIRPFRNPARLELGAGRTDRSDPLDLESMYHYDIKHFANILETQ